MCPHQIFFILGKINTSQPGRRNYDSKLIFEIWKILSFIASADTVVAEPTYAFERRLGSLVTHVGYNRLKYTPVLIGYGL